MLLRILRLLVVALLLFGCSRTPGALFDAMMDTDDYGEFQILAGQAMDLGADSIPIFLAVLSREVPPERRLSLVELGKDDLCLARLNDLAQKGIFSIHEIPVLLGRIKEPMVVNGTLIGTLVEAEILERITGLNREYDAQFVNSYTEADEPKRLRMLAAWRDWYDQKNWYTRQ